MNKTAVSVSEELIPELQDYRCQIEVIKQDAQDLFAGMSNDQFNWRPRPGIWSIAECIDHLNVTGKKFIPNLDKMVARSRNNNYLSNGPFRHSFFGNLFVKLSEPPPRIKVRAPTVFAPSPDQPIEKVGPDFMKSQEELLERLKSANGVDLAKIKWPSPATKLLK